MAERTLRERHEAKMQRQDQIDAAFTRGMEEARVAAAAAAAPAAAPRQPIPSASQSRRWVFTLNNPRSPLPQEMPRGCRFLVYQQERGASGTAHLQGYLEFERAQRLSRVTGIFEGDYPQPQPRAHWEIARGTAEECVAYCSKSDTREPGTVGVTLGAPGGSTGQGRRSDLDAAAERVLSSGLVSDVPAGVFARYSSGLLKLAARVPGPYRPELRVVCIVGPTGIGKSYAVRDRYPHLYCPYYGNSGLWWDGYTDQRVVLLEEFAGQVQLQKLLQILDPYPSSLECKGGSVASRFNLVFLTSNRSPTEWYRDENGTRAGEFAALYRRLGLGGLDGVGPGRYIEAADREGLSASLDAALEGHPTRPEPGGLQGCARLDPQVPQEAPAPAPADDPPLQPLARRQRLDASAAQDPHPVPQLDH